MALLTHSEASTKLAISDRQLKRLIDDGLLPVVSLGSSRKGDRIDERDLEQFIHRRKINRSCQSSVSKTAKVLPITSVSKSVDDELAALYGAAGSKRKKSKRN